MSEAKIKAEAEQRAARARSYAEKFPAFSKPDAPWCSVEWQVEQLRVFTKSPDTTS